MHMCSLGEKMPVCRRAKERDGHTYCAAQLHTQRLWTVSEFVSVPTCPSCSNSKESLFDQTLTTLFRALSHLGLNFSTSVFVSAFADFSKDPAKSTEPEFPVRHI